MVNIKQKGRFPISFLVLDKKHYSDEKNRQIQSVVLLNLFLDVRINILEHISFEYLLFVENIYYSHVRYFNHINYGKEHLHFLCNI